ncbi:MAG: TonB-dependent receptor plug domain-containing protein, partial [Armatimonadota bacterium]|nr:TonB-dependent receptor plug domain-containing protein [Armatimonadota bacterium]
MKRRGVALATCVLGVSWLLSLPVVRAEESAEPEEEEIVVTARRRKETRAVVPESTTVITREDIERSNAQNVVDLLNREPGVFVNRQGGLGYGGNVQVRGLGGNPPTRSLVLVDGHPDFMGIMGHSL